MKSKLSQVYVTHEELHDNELLQYGGLEFPQINYDKCNGKPYRYFYSCGFGHVFADSLLKMDVHTRELKVSVSRTSRSRPHPILSHQSHFCRWGQRLWGWFL